MFSSGFVRWTLQLLAITVLLGLAFPVEGVVDTWPDELAVEEEQVVMDDHAVAQGAGANETDSPGGDAPCEPPGPCEDVVADDVLAADALPDLDDE